MTRATGSWASTPGVRRRMQLQRSQHTQPEVRLRQALHKRGLRFRIQRQLIPGLRRSTDITFGPARVAVFVNGCFWHGCPEHYRPPTTNERYWHPKIARNQIRDAETDAMLTADGWLVVRVWEHEATDDAADRITAAVKARRLTLRAR